MKEKPQMNGVNSTAPRPDLGEDLFPEGDLPEQFGGAYEPLLPGVDVFQLPTELSQLWDTVDMTDGRTNKPVARLRLRCDRHHPLVIVGGKNDGKTMTVTFTTNPRPRGRKNDPTTVWVSDLAYFLEIALNNKTRPKSTAALQLAINQYAGKTFRMEHGLSAHCREDRPRYIPEVDPTTNKVTGDAVLDPTGTMGCGKRYYTRAFKLDDVKPGEEPYDDRIQCECGALLRGFPSCDRFLSPAGQK
jgi:hypothetical protein